MKSAKPYLSAGGRKRRKRANKPQTLNIQKHTKMEKEKNMTAEHSLEIIRDSIEQSQRTITKNIGIPLIWWGACVVVFSLLIAYLWKNHGGPVWNLLWFALWVVGCLGERFLRNKRTPVPSNLVGRTISHIWGTFGIFCGFIGGIFGLIGGGLIPLELVMPQVYVFGIITSIISLCFGMGATIMGFVLRNIIIKVCGIIAGIGGFFCALHFLGAEQLFVMAAVAVIGLIVPGIVIYLQYKK